MAITIAITIATILITTLLPIEIVAQFDCSNEIANLYPCYSYIQGRDSFPSSDCCNRLEDVVNRRSECLCEVVRGNGAINQTRFLELPAACGFQTSSVDNCNYGNTPPFYSPPYYSGTPPYYSGSPPYYPGSRPPYYYSGYSTKILNSLLVSVVTAATCVQTLIIF
ncbi:hypothetical protein CASFOL_005223 [Castilleja foliolosa]|uniref:Bifunctional inhibitor/plant lipid transfer protein/seed storage helical domain-containing protein n=1 Tax=Castilleja foliolosa TaxID=1961234 RepID=A0ABD3E6U1_9LAMI